MKIIEGNLTMLGNAQIQSNGIRKYSIIEIGDSVLKGCRVPGTIDNFLSKALDETGTTTLYLNGKLIVGVKTPNGKIYYYDGSYIGFLLFLGLGIFLSIALGSLFLPLSVLGLFFIWQAYGEFENIRIGKLLKSEGGVGISGTGK